MIEIVYVLPRMTRAYIILLHIDICLN